MMIDTLLLVGLLILTAAGVFLAALQMPGVWIVLASAAGYDWHYSWTRIGIKWLIALLVVAIAAEAFDFLSGLVAAKKAGASRRAAVGSLLGGFLGMIFISVAVPIPGLGAVIGGLIGCFLGALVAELSLKKDFATGTRVGIFATAGKVVGLVAKTSASVIIGGVVVSLAIWSTFWGAAPL